MSATNTDTTLTQPTGLAAGELVKLYQPAPLRPGGTHHRGFFVRLAGSRPEMPHKELSMCTNDNSHGLSRSKVVSTLAQIRQEWELAADGVSLLEVRTRVGYLLLDFANGLDLTGTERQAALGSDLFEELNNSLVPPTS